MAYETKICQRGNRVKIRAALIHTKLLTFIGQSHTQKYVCRHLHLRKILHPNSQATVIDQVCCEEA